MKAKMKKNGVPELCTRETCILDKQPGIKVCEECEHYAVIERYRWDYELGNYFLEEKDKA